MLLNAALRYTTCRSHKTVVLSTFTAVAAHCRLFTSVESPSIGGGVRGNSVPTAAAGTSGASNTTSACTSSASTPQAGPKESRFTRTNVVEVQNDPHGVAQHGTRATNDGGGGDIAAPFMSLESQMTQVASPRGMHSCRTLFMYLQRVQSMLRRSHHLSLAAHVRYELNSIFLPATKGLDTSTVTLLLQTLRLADVGDNVPILHDAVAWLSLHGYQLTLPQFTKVVELLHYFKSSLVEEWIRSLPQRLPRQDVAALTVVQVVPLLTALLPCLQYPSATITKGTDNLAGRNVKNELAAAERVESSAADSSLVQFAELLRERCKGSEFVTCDPNLTAQLLRALLGFESSHEWRFVQNREAWTSLQEAACVILATPAQTKTMDLATAVQLLDGLMAKRRVASQQQQQHGLHRLHCVGATTAESTTQAEEHLTSVLTEKLLSAVGALEHIPRDASAELPAPWRLGDVQELWNTCLRNTSTASGENLDPAYQELLTNCKTSLLAFVVKFYAAHHSDVGAAELAFAVARGVAAADRAAAQYALEATPITTDTSGATTADPPLSNLSDVLPSSFLEALMLGTSEQLHNNDSNKNIVTWKPTTVKDAVTLFEHSSDRSHRSLALDLAQRWYKQLQARAQSGERLLPQELLAFFTPELLRRERLGVDAAVLASLRRWSVSEVLYFFAHLGAASVATTAANSNNGWLESAAVLRQAGTALCTYASKASAAQLAALVECYGVARVRNDDFCEAAISRLAELLDVSLTAVTRNVDFSTVHTVQESGRTSHSPPYASEGGAAGDADAASSGNAYSDKSSSDGNRRVDESAKSSSPVTLPQLTQILRSFALMEARQTKPFIDAAPYVTQAAAEDQGSAQDITQLLAAYAKMLIWNYPVFRALAERLCRIRREDVRLSELVTAQLALLRMDVTLPAVTVRFYDALTERYAGDSVRGMQDTVKGIMEEPPLSPRAALNDAVMQLSVFSRLRSRSHVPLPDASVSVGLVQFIVQRAELLRVEELAEVLLSLARLDQGGSTAFEELTVRTLGLLPTAPPRVMAHIAEAYAQAGRGGDTELFTLIAERTVAMRHDMAAITIASILASFAKAGVRNDRLFIEVIPRVRHVGTYGTPRDIVNVVSAYAAVNLWHYKLFARLADRAIQQRADFRVTELVRLLQAYAAVQMRYDVLFTEFAPRIQTLAHLLTPADLAAVASSYSRLNIPCVPVWKATASRAVDVADAFTEAEAEQLLDAYSTQGFYDAECVKALTTRFPALADIPFDVKDTKAAKSAEEKASNQV